MMISVLIVMLKLCCVIFQNYDDIKKDGENKVIKITAICEKVVPNTLSEGQEIIFSDVKKIKLKLSNFSTNVIKVEQFLYFDNNIDINNNFSLKFAIN